MYMYARREGRRVSEWVCSGTESRVETFKGPSQATKPMMMMRGIYKNQSINLKKVCINVWGYDGMA